MRKQIDENMTNSLNKPLVSIITVVKNSSNNIENTIKSVLEQTYKNIEYIVIEGKSKDDSFTKVKKYKKYLSILLSEKDRGIFDAMNKGIVLSSGNIIGIINSGDTFKNNAVEIAIKHLKKIDYLFGPIKKNRVLFNFKPNLIDYKFNIFPSHSASFFVKKKLHEELGLYNIKYKLSADNDFIFKLIKLKKKYLILNPKNLFGICQPHNYSSKFSIIEHLNEEFKIRYGNNQSILFIIILYIVKLVYSMYSRIKKFFL